MLVRGPAFLNMTSRWHADFIRGGLGGGERLVKGMVDSDA